LDAVRDQEVRVASRIVYIKHISCREKEKCHSKKVKASAYCHRP